MRIGILTLPLHTNYGGILQAYALQTVLERMGNQVVVYDLPFEKFKLPSWKLPLAYAKRIIKRYILGHKDVYLFQEKEDFERSVIERQFTQPFIYKHIHRYIIHSFSDINKEDFDAIVVGSDQIWRMMYFEGFYNDLNDADAFLAFTEGWNIKRVSYAASFGTDTTEVRPECLNACKSALSKFDGVSVREKSGVDVCKNTFGVDASWVLDPTMLLNPNDYKKLFKGKIQDTTQHTLVSYILDETPEIEQLREKIAKDKGLIVIKTNVAETDSNERITPLHTRTQDIVSQPPVENWLYSLYNADYIINDSFHACVFSILFHKQFTVIANKKRGKSRFKSLLSIFGLEDRIITSPEEYCQLPDIDYTKVDVILNQKRKESIGFLRKFFSTNE